MTKYILSLDIGTNSVGWAVTDNQFNLVQGKKKINDNGHKRKSRTNLWGVRLFDEGTVAESRRLSRGQRRRYTRRRERLNYLRGIFAEEMQALDENFFVRLNESFYQMNDKKAVSFQYRDVQGNLQTKKIDRKEVVKYPLFPTKELEQKHYHNYPTIYHLRHHLATSNEKADLREVYLAMHHILKYRGHFTNQGQQFDLKNLNIATSLEETLKVFFVDVLAMKNSPDVDMNEVNTVLANITISRSAKVDALNKLYTLDKEQQKQLKALFTAIVGNKMNVSAIFANPEYAEKENEKTKDLYYSKEEIDAKLLDLEGTLTDQELQVLILGKKVYESILLSAILNGHESLSEAMVEKYEQHQKQLRQLKQISLSISHEFYQKIFKEDGIYTNYVEGKGNPAKTSTLEEFYKALKAHFAKALEIKFPLKNIDMLSDDLKQFLVEMEEKIEQETYLLKQRMYKNGAIPYQIHEQELVQMIERQKQHYPFLGETIVVKREDEEGVELTSEEYKIQTLMKFRIPYYVGPLTEANLGESGKKYSEKSAFAWMQKTTDEKITPWNFDEVVNKEASASEFIERMTGFCTYLPNEKVLPKNSLVYQEFNVYNELITAGYYEKSLGDKVSKQYFHADLMRDLVNDLFKKQRKVYAKDVINYLQKVHHIEAIELFGIDNQSVNGKPSFNNTLSTYLDLTNKCGISPEMIAMNPTIFEEIIKWQTIFEDKKVLTKTIKRHNENEWQHLLSDEQVKKLSGIRYTGFGKLSNKLINGIRDKKSQLTILEQLKNGGYHNFMRLIAGETGDQYSYKETIQNAQSENIDNEGLSYQVVADLAGSAAIKKGIWQSLQIIQELEKVLGRENIDKIVVEMSREDGGRRTKSRYKQLETLYKDFVEKNQAVAKELQSYEKDQDQLKKEKLYLYFMQNGQCAYTNTTLNISDLSNYEVDHIVPQSYIKDDSLDNKVLVTKEANQKKGDGVPNRTIINNRKPFWEMLVKNKLMSPRKFKNLTMEKIGDRTREGFINRQLVENRQIIKHVVTLLSKYFEDTETVILTPKAALTSQFRKGLVYVFGQKDPEKLHDGFRKNRELNDYHHAHDAYLNAVVANYLYLTKPELKNAWVYGQYERNASDVFGKYAHDRRRKSLHLLSEMMDEVWTDKETGEIIGYRDDILAKIEKTLNYRNINIVKKVEVQKGKFGDESVYKKDEKAKNFASGIKNHLDAQQYGGTKAPVSAFMVIIKNQKGEVKPLSIPVMLADNYLAAEKQLHFLQELYPKEKIVEIVTKQVSKYTKYQVANGGVRKVASYQEAQSGSQLPMMRNFSQDSSAEDLLAVFDTIAHFITEQRLFTEKKMEALPLIRKNFDLSSSEEKVAILQEMLRVTKGQNQGLKALSKSGLGTTAQQLKSGNLITNDTTLIYQSITGLYETRKTLN